MNNVKYWLKYIDENNLATTDYDSVLNQNIHRKKYNFDENISKHLKIIHSEVSFKETCYYWKSSKSRRLNERFGSIMACIFKGQSNYLCEGFLDELMYTHMDGKNILYIILDIVDYGLDDDIKDINVYVPHCCTLLLIPNKGIYEAFYINSHGKDLLIYTDYQYALSKRKKKTIHYEQPVDAVFMYNFLKFMYNKYKLNIKYDFTYKHNYYGADYQSGDNYGICFIFPYLIWYNFCMYYNKERILNNKIGGVYKIKSSRDMLLDGNLTECIQSYLLGLNKNYDKMYLKLLKSQKYNRKYYINKFDKILEKSKNHFVEKVLNKYVPYLVE